MCAIFSMSAGGVSYEMVCTTRGICVLSNKKIIGRDCKGRRLVVSEVKERRETFSFAQCVLRRSLGREVRPYVASEFRMSWQDACGRERRNVRIMFARGRHGAGKILNERTGEQRKVVHRGRYLNVILKTVSSFCGKQTILSVTLSVQTFPRLCSVVSVPAVLGSSSLP